MIELTNDIKLYIPTTSPNEIVDRITDVVLTQFSTWFGGATTYAATGAWLSQQHGIVREPICVVEAFSTPDSLAKHKSDIVKLCVAIKHLLSQEAVAFEHNHTMYLV